MKLNNKKRIAIAREGEKGGKGKADREEREGHGVEQQRWGKVLSGLFQLPGIAFSKTALDLHLL